MISPKQEKRVKTSNALYSYLQDFLHFTLGNDDDDNVEQKIEEETHLKKELTEIPQLFRQHTKITNKRRPDFLKVTEMSPIEKVYVDFDLFPDKYPLRKCRKFFILSYMRLKNFSKKLVKSKLFEVVSMIIIIMNCITYIMRQNQQGEYKPYFEVITEFETVFLVFYLIEMGIKMLGFGLFFDKHSYFRDGWNILDFFVIFNLIFLYFNVTSKLIKDYSLLRIIRLLRPLKALTRFAKLRTIISSLFAALPLLLDFLAILLFFFLIYAAVGLNLFSGLLTYRCQDPISGLLYQPETVCGNAICPDQCVCTRGLKNLEGGVVSFDNLLYSLLQVMFIATLDNWSYIMYNIQRAFTNYAWIYFVSLVICGNYIILNLTLALIKVKFSETHNMLKDGKKKTKRSSKTFDFIDIKRQGLWLGRRKMSQIIVNKNQEENNVQNQEIIHKNSSLNNLNNDENKINFGSNLKQILPYRQSKKNRESSGSSLAQINMKKINHNSPAQVSSYNPSKNYEKRRGANEFNQGQGLKNLNANRTKTLKSYKSRVSSFTSKRRDKSSIAPSSNPTQLKKSFVKNETTYMNSESLFSFISMDSVNSHSNLKLYNSFMKNRCFKCFFGLFSKVYKNIPIRGKTHHHTYFYLQPKYLKLIVDYEKEYVSSSENDILPNKMKEMQNKLISEQLNLLKRKKLPVIYAPKQKKASLLKFLRKIYSKKLATTTNNNNGKNGLKDIILCSGNSNSSLNSIEEKIFKTMNTKKGIAVKNTRRFSGRKKEKTLTNTSLMSQNKFENYVFNFQDLFGGGSENSKEKIEKVKASEKMKKKFNQIFLKNIKNAEENKDGSRSPGSPKKKAAPYGMNNYNLVKNLINCNIEDNEEEQKDIEASHIASSIDMPKKYLEIRVFFLFKKKNLLFSSRKKI